MSSVPIQTEGLAEVGRVQARHGRAYGQWVAVAFLIYVLAGIGKSVWTNQNVSHSTITHYLLQAQILKGVLVTLEITALSLGIGMIAALVLALMRLSSNRALSGFAWIYIQIYRGVPPLVQLLFWGFMGAVFRRLSLSLPFTGLSAVSVDTNSVLTPFVAAVVALSMLQAAYGAEILRSGIMAVPSGQVEAAAALGLTRTETLRRIVLPQAMRIIIPPLGNQITFLLKATSLVSVIGGSELMTTVQRIYGQNLDVIPMLIVASVWYIILVTVFSVAQFFIERHFALTRTTIRGVTLG